MTAFAKERAAYVARAEKEAARFQADLRRKGAHWRFGREGFSALIVDEKVATRAEVLAALVDFARPALDFSELPRDMYAWATQIGEAHVAFYDSSPTVGEWIEGETLERRFGALPAYIHVEHRVKDPASDQWVEAEKKKLRIFCKQRSDYGRRFQSNARKPDDGDPWRMLKERFGFGLGELLAAVDEAEAHVLIHDGVVVLRGVPRNEIAVRRKVDREPEPKRTFDEVIEEAESEWVESFEAGIFRHARAVATKKNVPRLRELLTKKGPRPRSARIALAALSMLGEIASAEEMIAWTQKTSEPLRRAAICALASLGERARPALVEGSSSKKLLEKRACLGLLGALDEAPFAEIRKLRDARGKVPAKVRERLVSDDLVAIHARDLDAAFRDEERDAILRRGGAALCAWYFGWKLESFDPSRSRGMVVEYEQILDLAAGDPLGAYLLPLVLLERPLGDAMFEGEAQRTKLVAKAKTRFGARFGKALTAVQSVFAK